MKYNVVNLEYNNNIWDHKWTYPSRSNMTNITFIGNCQTVALCFFFQQLTNKDNYNIYWVLYGDEFKQHIGDWSHKCKNMLFDDNNIKKQLMVSDIIIFQEISELKSKISNKKFLKIINKNCKLICIPCAYINYNEFNNFIKELQKRERNKNVDIIYSDILIKFKNDRLCTKLPNHPTTFFFMEIMKKICLYINIPFFDIDSYNYFLQKVNYMELPDGMKPEKKRERKMHEIRVIELSKNTY